MRFLKFSAREVDSTPELARRYWRFTGQRNADGAVRKAAGSRLRDACLALPPLEPRAIDGEEPRDISRWAETAKRGTSKVLRCSPGAAVATRGFELDAEWCVHAVAPDSEFGYEGLYMGHPGVRGEDVRYYSAPPLLRFRATYEAALAACHDKGATTVSCPALGAGVKGWRPSISAAMALDALARDPRRDDFECIDLVLGSDAAWVAFNKSFEALIGGPDEKQRVDDAFVWHFAPRADEARLPHDLETDTTLRLHRIPELVPKPPRKAGYAGEFWRPTNNGW